jgi:hypothetical protein
MNEGHTNYYCKYLKPNEREFDARWVYTEFYYEICQVIINHTIKDYPNNLKNGKPKWCAIYEELTTQKTK